MKTCEESIRDYILRSGDNIIINHGLMYEIGKNEATLYSILLFDEHTFKLKDGYFPITIDELRYESSLGKHVIENAMNNLIELRLISKKQMGTYRCNYYRIIDNIDYVKRLIANGLKKKHDFGIKLGVIVDEE